MKRIAVVLIILPLAGVAFGVGVSTLYWSSQMTRQFERQAQWKALVEKQNVTLKEQSDALRNLTAATARLIEATKAR